MQLITAPLYVYQSKKKNFVLNLNIYRNAHYQTLNKAKVQYKAELKEQIAALPKYSQVIIEYKYFPGSARRSDTGNVAAIHQKFFEDALVELGKIPDDDYKHVLHTLQSHGGIDIDNPRVEIRIIEIPKGANPYEYLAGFQ